jgi:hypothetical protein
MPRPKRDAHLLYLARHGAEVRLRELAQEVKTLVGLFPDLRDSFDADEMPVPFIIAKGAGRVKRATVAERPRPRRQMSAAARKRASQRMKRRWTQWREERERGGKKTKA